MWTIVQSRTNATKKCFQLIHTFYYLYNKEKICFSLPWRHIALHYMYHDHLQSLWTETRGIRSNHGHACNDRRKCLLDIIQITPAFAQPPASKSIMCFRSNTRKPISKQIQRLISSDSKQQWFLRAGLVFVSLQWRRGSLSLSASPSAMPHITKQNCFRFSSIIVFVLQRSSCMEQHFRMPQMTS